MAGCQGVSSVAIVTDGGVSDFTGKWKMLHYLARDFFAPTLVTGYLDASRQLRVFVVSEVPSLIGSALNATVLVEVFNWAEPRPVTSKSVPVTIVILLIFNDLCWI